MILRLLGILAGVLAKATDGNMPADQETTVGMFRSLGFEPEALLRDHVCDDDGNLHDLMLLAHSVEASLASLEAVGLGDAAA